MFQNAFRSCVLKCVPARCARALDCACSMLFYHARYVKHLPPHMRQLPPATGKAPFVVEPCVRDFEFRVLRQNRRVVADESRRAELELFHDVLTDISMCQATQKVRDFIIAAYVRGATIGAAEHTPLEGNTAVFTKRRYRDAWNRSVTRRVSRSHNHAVKIKAKVRARGTRGQNWYGDKRVSFIRSKVRTQNAWLLHLAGDFHASFETKQVLHRPHLMRVMLTSNMAVDQIRCCLSDGLPGYAYLTIAGRVIC